MSRTPLPLLVPDASRFARSLGQSLKTRHAAGSPPPGHVELLNLMARALGHRNLQSLQAATATATASVPSGAAPGAQPGAGSGRTSDPTSGAASASARPATSESVAALPPRAPSARATGLPRPVLAAEDAPASLALTAHARKALAQFDSRGRLARWPHKLSVQRLAMWVLWSRFDGRRVYTEREVNDILRAAHSFGDHATLRRELINHRLMSRKPDCSDYRKLPARPDDEARALLQAWRQQQRAPAAAQAGAAAQPRPDSGRRPAPH